MGLQTGPAHSLYADQMVRLENLTAATEAGFGVHPVHTEDRSMNENAFSPADASRRAVVLGGLTATVAVESLSPH